MSDNLQSGVSGMSLYVPRLRVPLESWCDWTGNSWDKVRAVVGRGFRLPASHENVYTMAAEAALRLIRRYDIDPRRVGLLALGTESSRDNSAGAVIVRGMLDQALTKLGLPPLARDCEVPEFKHACLGGVYALKTALRYTRGDGADRAAIVVASDIAEYARGSSGEQTQGAGAVAMLVERGPKLFTVDLDRAGSASAYRGPDFRKPVARHFDAAYAAQLPPGRDFPIFSGRYSTYAYLDEIGQAFDAMLGRLRMSAQEFLDSAKAAFFHRPYHYMPIQGLAFLYVRALAASAHAGDLLAECCRDAEVSLAALRTEAAATPDLYAEFAANGEPIDAHPLTTAVAAVLRKRQWFRDRVQELMSLGKEAVMELGNLYTAALPAWVAAGFADAAARGIELAGAPLLALGYGSGDAAESMPIRAVPAWQTAAAKLDVNGALANAPIDLEREQYEALHDGNKDGVPAIPASGFAIDRVGREYSPDFQDLGVEYYAWSAG
ncbi:MAG TPA: hydroxymethylglutaryl-CoA synthase [Gammaproteobacteria bacterium]|nr:hydroxymethylglutaryl-CoA synthase [Gammaproteobacteria bacterium]